MHVNRDQLKSKLRGLLSLVRSDHSLTLEELRSWGFELEDQVVLGSHNIHAIMGIKAVRISAIQSLHEPAARALFDEEISNACALIEEDNRIVEIDRRETGPLAITPFAVVRQEPVGHGGFHTGALGTNRPCFRWVYDCGSWTKQSALQSQIAAFEQRCRLDESRRTDIDLLFISHFDADHISGLGILLGPSGRPRLHIHTAVIPYISPATGFVILSAAVAQGRCTDDLIDAVFQPAKFCAERRIQRLIIMRPRGSDSIAGEGAPPPSSPPTLWRTRPSGRVTERILSSEFIQPDGSVLPTRTQSGIEVAEALPGSVCGIVAYDVAWADWWFVPHAHEWNTGSERLEQAAKEIVGLYPDESGFDETLIEKFRSPSELRRIRDMFRPMNANGTSLSLYVGPPPDFNGRISYGSPQNRRTGWLLTGDTPLKSKRRIGPWKDSFRTVAKDIGQLMLPHHGAAKNFNSELLTFALEAKCFATANAEDDRKETRPPFSVRDEVGKRLTVVSEEGEALIDCSGDPSHENQYADGIRSW